MTTGHDAKAAIGADPLVGMVLDRYRVIEKLGEGGMGAVYAVEHVMLQKRMAMKLLRADLSRNQDLVTRFQNEAIAASRIGQENIVAVTDFGRTPDGLVYFVMEELHGKSLADVIRSEGGLSVTRTVGIAAQVCRALNAAHQAGIVHRDLKPENIILVAREGMVDFVKVLDFGISKMAEQQRGGARLTQVGMIVGTPEYMSPEQASGQIVDARSDVYALGVVLFEMLTGRLPFNGENALQILMKHQTQPPPTLAQARAGVPFSASVEGMVAKALSKRPDDRQQSMAECLADIQRFAEQLRMTQPELALPPSNGLTPTDPLDASRFPSQPNWASPTTVTPASSLPPPVAEDQPPPHAADLAEDLQSLRPRRTGLWIALVVLLVGAGLGVFALSRHGPSQADLPVVPVPTPVAEPAPAALPPPPALAPPPAPAELAAPPPPVVSPPVPAPEPARVAPSRPTRPHRVAAEETAAPKQPPAPAVAKPAPTPVDFPKMDDLKSAY